MGDGLGYGVYAIATCDSNSQRLYMVLLLGVGLGQYATIYRSDNLGVTFVIVTHDLGSIFTATDRVILLDRKAKGIITQGDPRKLRDESHDPRVRAFFRREAEPAAA